MSDFDQPNQRGFADIVDSFYKGRARARQELDADRGWGQTILHDEQEQAKSDPYNRIVRGENGIAQGLEENIPYQKRDELPTKTRFPEFFRKEPAPPGAPFPAFDKASTPQLNPAMQDSSGMGSLNDQYGAPEQGNRKPQSAALGTEGTGEPQEGQRDPGDPKPLLVDHKAKAMSASERRKMIMQDAQQKERLTQAGAKTFDTGKRNKSGGKVKVAVSPDQITQPGDELQVNPDTGEVRQRANFSEQPVVGDAPTQEDFMPGNGMDTGSRLPMLGSAPPLEPTREPAENYNPTPYMRKRITDMATGSPKDSQTHMVQLSSLPLSLREKLGIGEDANGSIPSDVLRAWLAMSGGIERADITGRYGVEKARAGQENRMLPQDAIPFLQAVEDGSMSPGDAIEAAQKQGVPITKAVTDAFYSRERSNQFTQAEANKDKRATVSGQRQERTKYASFVGDAVKAYTKDFDGFLEQSQAARSAKQLANSKNTQGMLRAIQTMLSKAAGERGALSEADVSGFGGGEGYFERLDQFAAKAQNEGLTPENVKIVNRLTDEFNRAAENKNRAQSRAIVRGLRAKVNAYGLSPDDAEELFQAEMGGLLDEFKADSEAKPTAKKAPNGTTKTSAPVKESQSSPKSDEELQAKYEDALKKVLEIKDPKKRRSGLVKLDENYQKLKQSAGKK